jgi:plasmid stabilization system protein ParE
VTSKRAVLSEEAKSDLREIKAYIVEHTGEMRAATVLKRLDDAFRKLASRPNLGRTRIYLEGRRAFSKPPWIIVYRPLPEGDGVLIQRVLDSRRNLPALFRGNP